MKLLKLWRTFKEGMKNFYRNGWLTFAAVSILTISLYVMMLTILAAIGANSAVKTVQDQVNISIYFNPGVTEKRILEIKDKLEGYREVAYVEYISKHKAQDELLAREKEDSSIRKALEVIGENPLPNSLVVKAQDPEQYDVIYQAVSQSTFSEEIHWINYEKYKSDIEKVTNFVSFVKKLGIVLGTIFILVAALITFNTIRITIYSQKRELEVMRLVGASNIYVRMPYIFEGIFYGISSALLSLLLLFLTFLFIAPVVQRNIERAKFASFFYEYFGFSLLMLLTTGILLGVISSFIAIRRYLKI